MICISREVRMQPKVWMVAIESTNGVMDESIAEIGWLSFWQLVRWYQFQQGSWLVHSRHRYMEPFVSVFKWPKVSRVSVDPKLDKRSYNAIIHSMRDEGNKKVIRRRRNRFTQAAAHFPYSIWAEGYLSLDLLATRCQDHHWSQVGLQRMVRNVGQEWQSLLVYMLCFLWLFVRVRSKSVRFILCKSPNH